MADYTELASLLHSARGRLSQSDLATRAGVSNKTISTYERAAFGQPGQPTKPDAGVLHRLAHALHCEPSAWFLAAGLEYNPDLAARTIQEMSARRGVEGDQITGSLGRAYDTLTELRTAKTPSVRVGIYKSTPYYESFDLRFAETVIGLINHEWKCDVVHHNSLDEQIESLTTASDRCHVVMGIMETLPRTSRGLRFIPYPGIEYRLNVVVGSAQPALTWVDIQEKIKDIVVIVAKADIGHEYMSVLAGPTATNLVVLDDRSPASFSAALDDAIRTAQDRPVIACTGEDVCCQILELSRSSDRHLLSTYDPSALRMLPTYRVGAYVRQDDTEWCELLRIAVEYAMRFAAIKMADIYAGLFSQLIPINSPENHPYCFGRLTRIPSDSCQEFLNQLERLLPGKFAHRLFNKTSYPAIAHHVVKDAMISGLGLQEHHLLDAINRLERMLEECAGLIELRAPCDKPTTGKE